MIPATDLTVGERAGVSRGTTPLRASVAAARNELFARTFATWHVRAAAADAAPVADNASVPAERAVSPSERHADAVDRSDRADAASAAGAQQAWRALVEQVAAPRTDAPSPERERPEESVRRGDALRADRPSTRTADASDERSDEADPVAHAEGADAAARAADVRAARAADRASHDPTRAVTDVQALDPALRERLAKVIDRMKQEGHEVTVTETWRSQARQDALYAQGRTAPGPIVTWTRQSRHLDGLAVDLQVNGSYADAEGYARLASIAQDEGLTSLGARDPGHLELHAGDAVLALGRVAPVREATIVVEPSRSRLGDFAGMARLAGMARVATVASVAPVATVASVARVAPASAAFTPLTREGVILPTPAGSGVGETGVALADAPAPGLALAPAITTTRLVPGLSPLAPDVKPTPDALTVVPEYTPTVFRAPRAVRVAPPVTERVPSPVATHDLSMDVGPTITPVSVPDAKAKPDGARRPDAPAQSDALAGIASFVEATPAETTVVPARALPDDRTPPAAAPARTGMTAPVAAALPAPAPTRMSEPPTAPVSAPALAAPATAGATSGSTTRQGSSEQDAHARDASAPEGRARIAGTGPAGSAFAALAGLSTGSMPSLGNLATASALRGTTSALRADEIASLIEARDHQPVSHMLLQVDDDAGGVDQIRVGVRGARVDAQLLLGDAGDAAIATTRMHELAQALEQRGLTLDGLKAATAMAGASTDLLRAATLDAPRTAGSPAQRQGDSARTPHDNTPRHRSRREPGDPR